MGVLRAVLVCSSVGVAVGCASTGVEGDAGADAGGRVTAGNACPSEGAKGSGYAPVCTDVIRVVQCTCTSGKWDCGHCPRCPNPLVLARTGMLCGPGTACEGPTVALRCDGSSATVTGMCRCGFDGPWTCDGVVDTVCDAGAVDAASD